MSAITRAWNRFFFTPTSAATLGVFRIFYGLIVFVAVLGPFPHRDIFYRADGIVSPHLMEKFFSNHWMILGFSFMPVTEPGLTYFMLGLMVAALMMSLGLLSRVASIVVCLGIYSVHNRNYFINNAGDLLMRVNSLILVFADTGAAYSLDRWLKARRLGKALPPKRISPWPVRLLQLQLSYLYCQTAILKMEGESWRDGTALYYALRYLELQRFHFKYLFYYLWQIKLATWGVQIAELSAGTLIWIKKLRYPILLTALSLHTGINLTMQFPVFQYVMMVNLLVFMYPEDVERWISSLSRGLGSKQKGEDSKLGREPGKQKNLAARLPLGECLEEARPI